MSETLIKHKALRDELEILLKKNHQISGYYESVLFDSLRSNGERLVQLMYDKLSKLTPPVHHPLGCMEETGESQGPETEED